MDYSTRKALAALERSSSITVFVVVILVILVAGIYGIVVGLDSTLTAESLHAPTVKVAVSAIILTGAIILYRVKMSRAQFVYGLAEIAVGIVANWRSLEGLERQLASPGAEDPIFARLAVLAGGLYLIGRGVANFAEGMKRIEVTRESAQKRVKSMKSGIGSPNPEAAPDG